MDTRNLVVGSRIEHGLHGSGAITFVGIHPSLDAVFAGLYARHVELV